MPASLERVLGAEAPTWAIILLVMPIVLVGLKLTVGIRFQGLPRVDLDYWWHLATGQWIIEHGRIPTGDPFSWSNEGRDWVAHEWLAEVLMALADRAGGYAGGIVLVGVAAVAGFWRLASGMRFYGMSRRAICLLVLLWGGAFLRPSIIVVRPQVLTFALLAVLLAELAAYETGRRRHLWLLPPLFLVWVNLNLTVFYGGLCLAAFALDRLLRNKLDRHLITICALSFIALFINPRGPLILPTALKYGDRDALRYQFVFEWMSPRLSDSSHLPFLLALPMAAFAAREVIRLRVWPAIPLLVLTYQSFIAVRFIPIYVILALFFAAWLTWRPAADRQSAPAEVRPLFPRAWWTPATATLAVLFTLTIALRTDASQFRRDPVPRRYPAVATDTLLAGCLDPITLEPRCPEPRLFNVYDYGGYLIYRFDEEHQVFIDGREEMYGEEFLRYYFALIDGAAGWEEEFERQGINVVLIRHIDDLSDEIVASPNWEVVYRNSVSALYVRHPNPDQPIESSP